MGKKYVETEFTGMNGECEEIRAWRNEMWNRVLCSTNDMNSDVCGRKRRRRKGKDCKEETGRENLLQSGMSDGKGIW